MGNNESTPRKEQGNSRNVSKAEVERALEKQRRLYEQRMQEVLQNQAATRQASQTATSSHIHISAVSSQAVAPSRPPPPAPTPTPRNTETGNVNCLERQSSPYSFIQNNSSKSPSQTNSSRPLYPNLNDNGNAAVFPGNNNKTQRQSLVNDFVFVNSNFKSPGRYSPSAPPDTSSARRDRSDSRSRSTPEDYDITCPTCKNQFGLKIFNCVSGHASCMECKLRYRPCGLCGANVTDRRNITLEEYVSDRKVPCRNADEGCSLCFKLGEMDQHLKECPFKETQCLLPGGMCHWKGKLSRMAAHFDNFHPTHRGNVDTEMFLQLHNMCDAKRMQLINIGNFNFVFHLIVSESENKIYVAVQLLGTKVSAEKWSYEIHIYHKGEPRRKYQYVDKCFSSGESVHDIVRENSCAVLPLQYAKTFINNGAVAYKVFIKKEVRPSISRREEPKRDVSSTRRGGRGGRGRGHYAPRGRGGHREF